jgi:hypothetical protein
MTANSDLIMKNINSHLTVYQQHTEDAEITKKLLDTTVYAVIEAADEMQKELHTVQAQFTEAKKQLSDQAVATAALESTLKKIDQHQQNRDNGRHKDRYTPAATREEIEKYAFSNKLGYGEVVTKATDLLLADDKQKEWQPLMEAVLILIKKEAEPMKRGLLTGTVENEINRAFCEIHNIPAYRSPWNNGTHESLKGTVFEGKTAMDVRKTVLDRLHQTMQITTRTTNGGTRFYILFER